MNKYIINNNMIKLYLDNELDNITKNLLKHQNWKWSSHQKCWIGESNNSNINIAKNIIGENAEKILQLDYNNTLVLFNRSHLYHNMIELKAQINICNKQAILKTYVEPIYYCENCDQYLIESDTLDEIKEQGIPLVKIQQSDDFVNGLHEESILHVMGYNVSQKEGLTKEQRRFLLRYFYENNYLSKDYIIYLLDFFLSNPTYGDIAHDKWEDDLEYIENIDKIRTVYKVQDPDALSNQCWLTWNKKYCWDKEEKCVLFDIDLSSLTIHFPERLYDIVELQCQCLNKHCNEIKLLDINGEDLNINTAKMKLFEKEDIKKYPLPWWWYDENR